MGKAISKAKARSFPAGIAVGVGVSLVCTLSICAILALLVESGRVKPSAMSYGVLVLLMVSATVGALVAGGQIKSMRLIVSVATAAAYWGVLLCITALFFGGMYQGVPVTALVVMGGGIMGGILPVGQGSTPRKHKRKRRYG